MFQENYNFKATNEPTIIQIREEERISVQRKRLGEKRILNRISIPNLDKIKEKRCPKENSNLLNRNLGKPKTFDQSTISLRYLRGGQDKENTLVPQSFPKEDKETALVPNSFPKEDKGTALVPNSFSQQDLNENLVHIVKREFSTFLSNDKKSLRPHSDKEANYIIGSEDCYELAAVDKAKGIYRALQSGEGEKCLSRATGLSPESSEIKTVTDIIAKQVNSFLNEISKTPMGQLSLDQQFMEIRHRESMFKMGKINLNQQHSAIWNSHQMQSMFYSLNECGKELATHRVLLNECNQDLKNVQAELTTTVTGQSQCLGKLVAAQNLTAHTQNEMSTVQKQMGTVKEELAATYKTLRETKYWRDIFGWSLAIIGASFIAIYALFFIARTAMWLQGTPKEQLPSYPFSKAFAKTNPTPLKKLLENPTTTAFIGTETGQGALAIAGCSVVSGIVGYKYGEANNAIAGGAQRYIAASTPNEITSIANPIASRNDNIISLAFKTLASILQKLGKVTEN